MCIYNGVYGMGRFIRYERYRSFESIAVLPLSSYAEDRLFDADVFVPYTVDGIIFYIYNNVLCDVSDNYLKEDFAAACYSLKDVTKNPEGVTFKISNVTLITSEYEIKIYDLERFSIEISPDEFIPLW